MSQELLRQIKNEVAKEGGFESYTDWISRFSEIDWIDSDIIAARYARAVAQQALENAAQNLVQTAGQWKSDFYSQKRSITDSKNIPL